MTSTINSIDNDNDNYDIPHERKYYHYNWSVEYHKWGKKVLPPFVGVYSIFGDIKDPSSWVPDAKFMENMLMDKLQMGLQCNDKVLFGSVSEGKDSNSYVSKGLSAVEQWGRWSDKKNVDLFFRFDVSACSPGMVSMRIRGFVRQSNPMQHAKVLLNGERIGDVTIKAGEQNPRDVAFNIPPELIKQGEVNVLKFQIDNPVSPQSLGLSGDARLLGIGFESMVFH